MRMVPSPSRSVNAPCCSALSKRSWTNCGAPTGPGMTSGSSSFSCPLVASCPRNPSRSGKCHASEVRNCAKGHVECRKGLSALLSFLPLHGFPSVVLQAASEDKVIVWHPVKASSSSAGKKAISTHSSKDRCGFWSIAGNLVRVRGIGTCVHNRSFSQLPSWNESAIAFSTACHGLKKLPSKMLEWLRFKKAPHDSTGHGPLTSWPSDRPHQKAAWQMTWICHRPPFGVCFLQFPLFWHGAAPGYQDACESFSHDLARFRRSVQALVLEGFDLIFELFLGGRLLGLVQRVLSRWKICICFPNELFQASVLLVEVLDERTPRLYRRLQVLSPWSM